MATTTAVTPIKDVEALNVVVAEMLRLRDQKKSLEKRLDEYKEAVTKYLKAAKMTEITTNYVSVSLSAGKSKRFDVNALRMDKPKLYQRYLTEEGFERLYYSPVLQSND